MLFIKKVFYIILIFICFNSVKGQQLFSGFDINKIGFSQPSKFTYFKGDLYFTADDGLHGRELWVTDGSIGGTRMLLNINTKYQAGSDPDNLIIYDDKLFFTADDGSNGIELWVTDGTTLGTVLFKDIYPGTQGSKPKALAVFKNRLFFSAADGLNKDELWVSDGTVNGTKMFKKINPTNQGSKIAHMFIFKNRLYFTTNIGFSQVYSTDGTDTGTHVHKGKNGLDINCSSAFKEFNGKLFFTGYDGANGAELWATDTMGQNAAMVKNINPGSNSSLPYVDSGYLIIYNNQLFFGADDGVNGRKLWVTDGTGNGTNLVNNTTWSGPGSFKVFNGKLFFVANDSLIQAAFVSDGTAAGTIKLQSIYPDGVSYNNVNSFTVFNNRLYYYTLGFEKRKLWSTDGTVSGTKIEHPDLPEPFTVFFEFKNMLYFGAGYDDGRNLELWRTDGTANGTAVFKDINTFMGSYPKDLKVVGNKLFFSADYYLSGRELWSIDNSGSTSMVKEIDTIQFKGSDPTNFTAYNGKLIFSADDGVHGKELWVSDATKAGTQMIKDIETVYPGGSTPSGFTEYKGKLYFSASSNYDRELWVTDGTAKGTMLVKNINANYSSDPAGFTVMGDKLYFSAWDGTNNIALWVTDGTEAGTLPLKVLYVSSGSTPYHLYAFKNKLYFAASNNAVGSPKLWESDGTAAGTKVFNDLKIYKNNYPWESTFIEYKGQLYFFADGGTGIRLWSSDGTPAGTNLVKNSVGRSFSSYPGMFMLYKDKLIFTASDSIHGQELCITDGTPAGTTNLIDLKKGKSGSEPYPLLVYNDLLYFLGKDSTYSQLFVTNGTDTGTHGITPSFADKDNKSQINRYDNILLNFVPFNNRVYFGANYNNIGMELWEIRAPNVPSLIKKVISTQQISLYPNPNNGSFELSIGRSDLNDAEIIVTDITGKQIYKQTVKEHSPVFPLQLCNTSPGIYLLVLKKGDEMFAAKFIVD